MEGNIVARSDLQIAGAHGWLLKWRSLFSTQHGARWGLNWYGCDSCAVLWKVSVFLTSSPGKTLVTRSDPWANF